MTRPILIHFICILILLSLPINGLYAQNKGFYIQGRKIYDSNGKEFIMRGISHAHTWFADKIHIVIPEISEKKANCVRIVLSNGERWTKNSSADVLNVIELCLRHNLIPILEVHDCTGYSEQSGSVPISTAVDYWIELKNILIGKEKYVIINIANEPYGNNVADDDWFNGHKAAIKRLRDEGFSHLLMVDGANWGQDWKNIMQSQAQKLLDTDPEKNIIFSVHMYDVYPDDSKVNNYLKYFVENGIPVCVGEFALNHGPGKPVAAKAILKRCNEYGISYIGWSWKGNNSPLESLDIVLEWDGGSLSTWGDLLINNVNGIKNTAKIASVFTTESMHKAVQYKQKKRFNNIANLPGSGFTVSFNLGSRQDVLLEIYNTKGSIIDQHRYPSLTPGGHTIRYRRSDIVSGTYIIRLLTQNQYELLQFIEVVR